MEKMIEEMWDIITSDCTNDCENCEFDSEQYCHSWFVVHQLYNAGYRKQSEGEWIKAPCSEKDGDAHCSQCGHWDWSDCKFCSNCGSRMKGGEG